MALALVGDMQVKAVDPRFEPPRVSEFARLGDLGGETVIQRECSARVRFKASIDASTALRELIVRPKINRNEYGRERSL